MFNKVFLSQDNAVLHSPSFILFLLAKEVLNVYKINIHIYIYNLSRLIHLLVFLFDEPLII